MNRSGGTVWPCALVHRSKASTPQVLRVGLTLAALLIPLQIFVGDLHGLNTLRHQPQKIAAMEGVWNTERGAPLLLFALPDDTQRRNHFEMAIPKLASLILTHDPEGEIKGLNDFRDRHPPVAPVFFAFRAMVGVGVLMLLSSWVGWWACRRTGWRVHGLSRPLLWLLVLMSMWRWSLMAVWAGMILAMRRN